MNRYNKMKKNINNQIFKKMMSNIFLIPLNNKINFRQLITKIILNVLKYLQMKIIKRNNKQIIMRLILQVNQKTLNNYNKLM